MKLPELPVELAIFTPTERQHDALNVFVTDYGKACDHQAILDAMKSRIYLSGPMTGIADFNFPLFNAEAARLRATGVDVVNPAELNPDTSMSWQDCMRTDIAALTTCHGIYMLPGWETSKGANLELHIAQRLGMFVLWNQGTGKLNDADIGACPQCRAGVLTELHQALRYDCDMGRNLGASLGKKFDKTAHHLGLLAVRYPHLAKALTVSKSRSI